jgi:hypothetical protein
MKFNSLLQQFTLLVFFPSFVDDTHIVDHVLNVVPTFYDYMQSLHH